MDRAYAEHLCSLAQFHEGSGESGLAEQHYREALGIYMDLFG